MRVAGVPRLVRTVVVASSVFAFLSLVPVHADRPTAIGARVILVGEDRYQFEVNIAHVDDSWEHFVDRWEVVGKGGKILATDRLYYPRIGENIVWRFLKGIKVDPGTEWVVYRLHDLKHGYGREKLVRMPVKGKTDTGWQ